VWLGGQGQYHGARVCVCVCVCPDALVSSHNALLPPLLRVYRIELLRAGDLALRALILTRTEIVFAFTLWSLSCAATCVLMCTCSSKCTFSGVCTFVMVSGETSLKPITRRLHKLQKAPHECLSAPQPPQLRSPGTYCVASCLSWQWLPLHEESINHYGFCALFLDKRFREIERSLTLTDEG
jgi:hypothetical protein